RHVDALSHELAAAGHDVVVLSRRPSGSDATTHPTALDAVPGTSDGRLRVLRAAEDPPLLAFDDDLVAWTLAWQHAAVRAALTHLRGWRPDVVHAHDWLAAHAAIALADAHEVPLIATVHATEAGRGGGRLTTPLQRQVHSVEWWLARRADALITCSAAMRDEVTALFGPSLAPVAVVHNGVAPRDWAVAPQAAAAARARWAPDGGPLLVHFGRLVYEKGVQDLIAALSLIRRRHPRTRLLVVGTGTHRDALVAQARDQGAADAVVFAGHLPDADLAAAVTGADAVVLPSRYEPFGIVALEAAAAGAPLVVARSGGLAEVVLDGSTGTSFPPGDVAALADAVGRVLDDPPEAARRAAAARGRLATDFDWPGIAARTAEVYTATRRRPPVALGRPTIPTGDMLLPGG
ncbi:MAG: glycogen synthase, partial [Pseudonocardiales bacterium]|nr:glycogen synthase [Pseudonocardiales bacterium]